MKKRYEVVATREGDWWVLRFPDLGGASQARRLDQIEVTARDFIYGMTDEQEQSFGLDLTIHVDPEADALLAEALAVKAEALQRQQAAKSLQWRAVQRLTASGLTVRDTGQLLGLTYQRVAQLRAEQEPQSNP